MKTIPFPFLSISGPPRERGIEYGQKAADRVQRSEEIYVRSMERRGYQWSDMKRIAREFAPAIASLDRRLLEEMEGIATGAAVDLETVIVVNARSEIFNGRHPESGPSDQEHGPDEGCTSALALGVATRDGQLIHGQNWDFNAECVDSAVVLRVERIDGPDILTFVEAGGLARCGFNSAGIAITGNNLRSDRDQNKTGVPLSIIRRRVLESATLAEAICAITATERAASNNMTVSAALGDEAINFETTPGETFSLWPDMSGLLAHANHFQSSVALSKLVDLNLRDKTICSTLYRDRRVMRHLAPRAGDLTVDDFKNAFADNFGAPYAVCHPPVEMSNGIISSTVATVIFEAAAGKLHARPAPYRAETTFTTYSISEGLLKMAAE